MNPEQKKFILENKKNDSPKELARRLGLKEKQIRKFLDQNKRPANSTPQRMPSQRLVFVGILLLAGLITYVNSFKGDFVFDDGYTLLRNTKIQTLWPFTKFFTTPRGLGDFTFALNFALGGRHPFGYHLINIVIHLAAGLVLYGILRRTFLLPSMPPSFQHDGSELAFIIALLWIVHPVQVQSVTYISQRYESLCGLFYLVTFYNTIRHAQDGASSNSKKWLLIAWISSACGMLTKEVMATAPLLILVYDRIFLASSIREIFRRRGHLYVGLFLTELVLVGVWIREAVILFLPEDQTWGAAGFGLKEITPVRYLLTQSGVLLYYLRLAVWPHPLAFLYDWPLAYHVHDVLGPLLGVGALFAITMFGLFKKPRLGFLGIAFFVPFLPSSSFIPLNDLIFEHRMYLSLAPALTLLVLIPYAASNRFSRRTSWVAFHKQWVAKLFFLAACIFSLLSIQRNGDYASHRGILEKNIRFAPGLAKLYVNLGELYMKEGAFQKAIEIYEKGLTMDPRSASLYNNLGHALVETGSLKQAVKAYQKAVELRPQFPEALHNLGIALMKLGNMKAAESYYRQTLTLDPNFAQTHYALGTLLASQGRYQEAFVHLEEALRLDPKNPRTVSYLKKFQEHLQKVGSGNQPQKK
ncbi:MAG: tetratricopeptide repeat protein [Candidatus Omnitrophica bacterium]|nr:tetratricopeptide repeat protein [Candidatus Omnitrophota bacterium]